MELELQLGTKFKAQITRNDILAPLDSNNLSIITYEAVLYKHLNSNDFCHLSIFST
jgi:hypothetical protein